MDREYSGRAAVVIGLVGIAIAVMVLIVAEWVLPLYPGMK